MQIKVRNKKIGDNAGVFVIAEIGTNHNGSLDIAKKMVKEAAAAKVDAVKIQIVNPDESYIKGSKSYRIFKKIYLDFNSLKDLKYEAEKRGLIFFATAGDISSLDAIIRLKAPIVKISSGSMTNILLVREAARTGLPIIISTGMSYLKEVKEVIAELENNKAREIIILHCTSVYPAGYEDLNLNSISTLKKAFRYPVGYSDHTKDNLACLVSVSMGARVIEKHFTLDKRSPGPDHYFSADPEELTGLVKAIRDIERMMGSAAKRPTETERILRNKVRRFLVFNKDLTKEDVLTKDNIGIKRIARGQRGLSSQHYDSIVGRKVIKNVKKNEPVRFGLLG